MGVLDELNMAVGEIRDANLPEYDNRLKSIETRLRDLEDRLRPLLQLLKTGRP